VECGIIKNHPLKNLKLSLLDLNTNISYLTYEEEENPSYKDTSFYSIKKAWSGALRKANIENFRWHDLRHHLASRLVMASVDLNTVRELLGHADIQMTLRYAHLAAEHKAEAVARLVPDTIPFPIRF
jgi:integrase